MTTGYAALTRQQRLIVDAAQALRDALTGTGAAEHIDTDWAVGAALHATDVVFTHADGFRTRDFTGQAPAAAAPVPSLTIPEGAWTPWGDVDEQGGRRAQLYATVTACGVLMHAYAIQVHIPGAVQESVQGDTFEAIHSLVGATGTWPTVEIGGRQYVIVMTPQA